LELKIYSIIISNPPEKFGVGLIGKLMVEFGISYVGTFLIAGVVLALQSKMYSAKRVFPVGGRLPPEL
jgi:hypothetical protein